VLQNSVRHFEQPTFIYAGTEGLFIPGGTPNADALWSLRLFVSGIYPEWRRCGYALTVATGVRGVHRDAPSLTDLEEVFRVIAEEIVPSVITFRDHTVSRLHQLPGRLHIVQQVDTYEWELPENNNLWMTRVVFPASNLNAVATPSSNTGWGVGESRDESCTKAIAEAIERFASGDLRENQRIIAKEVQLDGPIVHPHSVLRFSGDQLARRDHLFDYESDVSHAWVRAKRVDGEAVYVLAQQAYYPTKPVDLERPTYFTATSSGVAAHTDRATAQRRAYLELVERDAIMTTWLLRMSREHIDSTTLPAASNCIVKAIQAEGWDVRLINVTQSACPTVLGIAQNEGSLMLGASAGNPEEAVFKTLTELLSQVRMNQEEIKPLPPSEVKTTMDHFGLYRNPEYREQAQFLIASPDVIAFDALKEAEYGPSNEAVFLRLDHSYPGFENMEVWRCIDPTLVPMTFGYDTEPLGHPRVRGLVDTSQPLVPHPFA